MRLRDRIVRTICLISLAGGAIYAQSGQRTFATPQEAAQAVIDAAAANDTIALLKLFGPGGKEILQSGDAELDKSHRAEFATRARAKLTLSQDPTNPDHAVLLVGDEQWPFPVPIIRKGGQWRFDAARGKAEILAHRIGENELTIVEVCRAYVEAQMKYAEQDRNTKGVLEYAAKIASAPGKHDGLYWEDSSNALVPKAFADAAGSSPGKQPQPYHGYYFRILKSQGPQAPGGAFGYVIDGRMMGGFALIAWPSEYGESGVHTFIVSHHGVVYEKDLGKTTASFAGQTSRFNPDPTWKKVEE
jgi:hypothetical protein